MGLYENFHIALSFLRSLHCEDSGSPIDISIDQSRPIPAHLDWGGAHGGLGAAVGQALVVRGAVLPLALVAAHHRQPLARRVVLNIDIESMYIYTVKCREVPLTAQLLG